MQKQDSNISYPAYLLTLLLREIYTRQVSQLQVTSKDLWAGLHPGQEEDKAEAGPGMDTHLEVISSSPSAAEANCPITDRPEHIKDPGLTAKRHCGGRGREGMEQERSAVLCIAVLLKGWGRIQLAAARVKKGDFSHYNPFCVGKIKYFITVCIMYSASNSVKGFHGV